MKKEPTERRDIIDEGGKGCWGQILEVESLLVRAWILELEESGSSLSSADTGSVSLGKSLTSCETHFPPLWNEEMEGSDGQWWGLMTNA